MKNIKIDWSPVDNNSSSIEAMVAFASGESISEASKLCWDPAVKAIFRQLKKMPVNNARRRTVRWLRTLYEFKTPMYVKRNSRFLGNQTCC